MYRRQQRRCSGLKCSTDFFLVAACPAVIAPQALSSSDLVALRTAWRKSMQIAAVGTLPWLSSN